MLCELGEDARFVVIGRVAGAFNGWPVMLGTPSPAGGACGRVAMMPVEQARAAAGRRTGWRRAKSGAQRWVLPSGAELHVSTAPPGTRGYSDLARDAQSMQIAPGCPCRVASLIDLIRIAEASTGPDARTVRAGAVGDARDAPALG